MVVKVRPLVSQPYTYVITRSSMVSCFQSQDQSAASRVGMTPGGWYLVIFVTTFLYFYIYAVNYMRG